jgi:hypothetical protein
LVKKEQNCAAGILISCETEHRTRDEIHDINPRFKRGDLHFVALPYEAGARGEILRGMKATRPTTYHAPYADARLRESTKSAMLTSRSSALKQIEGRLRTFATPRLDAIIVALLCAIAGGLIGYGLRVAGMESMAVRYPLAVALTYPLFLGLLWLWSQEPWISRNVDFPSNWPGGNSSPSPTYQGGGGDFGGGGASGSWDDAPGFAGEIVEGTLEASASAEELAPVVFVAGVVIGTMVLLCGMAVGVVSFVWGAPGLLAELVLDAGTAGALYCFTRNATRRPWLEAASRRTAPAFIGLACVLGLAGFLLQLSAPDAVTMGEAIAMMRGR